MELGLEGNSYWSIRIQIFNPECVRVYECKTARVSVSAGMRGEVSGPALLMNRLFVSEANKKGH